MNKWQRIHVWSPFGQVMGPPQRYLVEIGHVEDGRFIADSATFTPDRLDQHITPWSISLDEANSLAKESYRYWGSASGTKKCL